jgi:hypothetical protein
MLFCLFRPDIAAHRQAHGGIQAAVRRVFKGQRTAVVFDDLVADRKAYAAAAPLELLPL